MARRRYHSTLQTVSDINITPLMDLTFLLLLTFVITAPQLEYEVDVSPPQMKAARIDEEKGIMINLTAQGKVYLERDVVSLPELTSRLREVKATRPASAALIRADGGRLYREVIGVMKAVRAAGFDNVSLITQPEQGERQS